MQPSVGPEPLDRRDRASLALEAEDEAGQHRLVIEQHGACAALAELAAVFGAAEIQILTQNLEQRLVRRERDLGRFAVDRQRDVRLLLHDECPFAPVSEEPAAVRLV